MNAISFRTRTGGAALLAALLPLGACPTTAADVCELGKFIDPGGAAYDNFGTAVGLSGGTLVAGASGNDVQCESCGSAFVYRWNGSSWIQTTQLFASEVDVNAQFGWSAAISGDVIVIGAERDLTTGTAFVFRWNGTAWVEEAKLYGSDHSAGNNDRFGHSVAVCGDTLVIGSRDDSTPVDDTGSAYVFWWTGQYWVEQAKLEASDGMAGDRFGTDVAIDGDVIVVGAPKVDHGGYGDNGAAYVYRRTGSYWNEEAKLVASDHAPDDAFGRGVGIDGDLIAIGANGNDDGTIDTGSVYVFTWDGNSWNEADELMPIGASDEAHMGTAVDVDGNVIVAGAYYENNENGTHAGAAYLYHWNGSSGSQFARLVAPDGDGGADWFGEAVAVDGDVVVLGASHDSGIGVSSGAAYVYGGASNYACDGWADSDVCAILDGIRTDYNRNLVADICSSEVFAYNVTADTLHDTIADAIDLAVSGDDLVATPAAFFDEPDIDFDARAITLASVWDLQQAAGGLIVLADGATLAAGEGDPMILNGELRLESGDTADVSAGSLDIESTGLLVCRDSSRLDVTTGDADLLGVTRVHDQATLVFTGQVNLDDSSVTTVFPGGALIADGDTSVTWYSFATVHEGGRISVGGLLTVQGSLIVDTGELTTGAALISAGAGLNGTVTLNASDFYAPGGCDVGGALSLLQGLMVAGPVSVGGNLLVSGTTVFAEGLNVFFAGRLDATGEIYSDVTNGGDVYCLGDTMVVGTYTNNGTTTVQVGTLTIVGTLVNNGTIIGDVVGGFADGGSTQPGDGLAIAGDYVAGADAALLLGDAMWVLEVGGDYDVAIDDHARYHMAEAELRMAGAWQSLELMSLDIGADRAGLDRTIAGHYPLGTLVIESGSTVSLADIHDNDGQGQALCEALYVRHLDLAPGATLNTLGCTVYYETAMIDGAIDDPANVIALPPPCPWDCDGSGDGQVSVTDFLAILAQWGQVGAPCDFDDDGVGVVDFLALLGHWGPCP